MTSLDATNPLYTVISYLNRRDIGVFSRICVHTFLSVFNRQYQVGLFNLKRRVEGYKRFGKEFMRCMILRASPSFCETPKLWLHKLIQLEGTHLLKQDIDEHDYVRRLSVVKPDEILDDVWRQSCFQAPRTCHKSKKLKKLFLNQLDLVLWQDFFPQFLRHLPISLPISSILCMKRGITSGRGVFSLDLDAQQFEVRKLTGQPISNILTPRYCSCISSDSQSVMSVLLSWMLEFPSLNVADLTRMDNDSICASCGALGVDLYTLDEYFSRVVVTLPLSVLVQYILTDKFIYPEESLTDLTHEIKIIISGEDVTKSRGNPLSWLYGPNPTPSAIITQFPKVEISGCIMPGMSLPAIQNIKSLIHQSPKIRIVSFINFHGCDIVPIIDPWRTNETEGGPKAIFPSDVVIRLPCLVDENGYNITYEKPVLAMFPPEYDNLIECLSLECVYPPVNTYGDESNMLSLFGQHTNLSLKSLFLGGLEFIEGGHPKGFLSSIGRYFSNLKVLEASNVRMPSNVNTVQCCDFKGCCVAENNTQHEKTDSTEESSDCDVSHIMTIKSQRRRNSISVGGRCCSSEFPHLPPTVEFETRGVIPRGMMKEFVSSCGNLRCGF